MRGALDTVLLAGALCGVASGARLAFAPVSCHRPFPAFVWTGTQAGDLGKLGYQHEPVDVQGVLKVVMEAAISSAHLEAVVVVLSEDNSFSTAGVSSAATEEGAPLHAQSATTTFAYAYPAAQAVDEAAREAARVAGYRFTGSALEDASSVLDALEEDSITDLVLATTARGESIRDTDRKVSALAERLEEASSGKYLLLWTGGFHGEGCGQRSLSLESAARRRLATVGSARTILITPDILSGLLVLLLFLFILLAGLGCLGDIECPQSFAHIKPAPGKEY